MNTTTVTNNYGKLGFTWYDYIAFALTLAFSIFTGIYHQYFVKKKLSVNEYLFGTRTMGVFPVAISLIAGNVSAMAIVAVPVDIYYYGAGYLMSAISMLIVPILTVVIYLPVLYRLQVSSVYEYLEQRFDAKIRVIVSCLNTLTLVTGTATHTYLPAVAIAAGADVNPELLASLICIICVIYISLGGFKAVIWTDVLQGVIFVVCMVLIIGFGVLIAGGFGTVLDTAQKGNRLNIFDFDLNPTKRDTFWVFFIGYTFHCVSILSIYQMYVQKYLSVGTFRESASTAFLQGIGLACTAVLSTLIGLVIYAKYADCDPFVTSKITKKDQLVTYFILDISQNYPGLSGVFIAGIFSASLRAAGSQLVIDPRTICKKTRRIRGKMADICNNKPVLLQQITNGVALGQKECQYQFRHRKWNCTSSRRSIRKVLLRDTRETGFVNAVLAAGVAYQVTRACTTGELLGCSCDRRMKNRRRNGKKTKALSVNTAPADGDWEWEGCGGDNVDFGIKKCKDFLDTRYRKRSDVKTLMKLHNYAVGRRAIKNYMSRDCKCHGLSGSCTLKTCWRKMPSFREVGSRLKERFDGAAKVIAGNDGQSFMLKDKTIKFSEKLDLVYSEETEDFCLANATLGSFGTQSRVCVHNSPGEEGCSILCCSRGFTKHTVTEVKNCKCKFEWCCEVKCEKCNETKEISTCS